MPKRSLPLSGRLRLSKKAIRPFSDKGNVRKTQLESCGIQAEFSCCCPARAPLGHTWATKGIFSDVHAARKNIETEFFDKLSRPLSGRLFLILGFTQI